MLQSNNKHWLGIHYVLWKNKKTSVSIGTSFNTTININV